MAGLPDTKSIRPKTPDVSRPSRTPPPAGATAPREARPPLVFEPNLGQADPRVRFLSRTDDYTLFLTDTSAVLAFHDAAFHNAAPVQIHPVCGRAAESIQGDDPTGGISNYFIGNDPSRWHTDIPNYRRVIYQGICPGVNLTYYGNPRQLEYDISLAPGADPNAVRMEYSGAESLRVGSNGDLLIQTKAGQLAQHRPRAFQEIGGRRVEIDVSYRLSGRNSTTFAVARYDRARQLLIDPVLVYSTFLGGTGGDAGTGIAVDPVGNIYITGRAGSIDFPTANPFQAQNAGNYDGFVAKLSPDGGTRLYTTYLGGNQADSGIGITVDAAGSAYVVGQTGSSNFPTLSSVQGFGGFFDGFITKLSPAGNSLMYSSFLGGGSADQAVGVAVDSNGNAYVAGWTLSTDFPTLNAFQSTLRGTENAFITKLNSTGTARMYSTYLGGTQTDLAGGIAIDSVGNAYIAGTTNSPDFPMQSAIQGTFGGNTDAFITKLNASGNALIYSTYLGGNQYDAAAGIGIDATGSVVVAGSTASTNFPTLNALQNAYGGGVTDVFITKINPGGSALVYSTYLGGSGNDQPTGMALDAVGNVYVTGRSAPGFPLKNPIYTSGGVFVTMLNQSGASLSYSTFLAGASSDSGAAIAYGVDGAYITGVTTSSGFPTVKALQPSYPGGTLGSAFVTVIGTPGLRSDFNRDGRVDVIWQDQASGYAQVWFLGGPQGNVLTDAANLTMSNPWRIVGVGDFNQDGHADVVWQDPVTGSSQVWMLGGPQGNVVTSATVLNFNNTWRIMAVADFNQDGRPDMIWQDPVTGLAQIWFMGGPQGTTIIDAVNLTNSNTFRIVGVGDFDQDGHPDVVWQDQASGAAQIWFLGGARGNVVTGAVTITSGNSMRIAAVADFNLDGRPDLVWQDLSTGTSLIWLMTGPQGATLGSTVPLSGPNAFRINGPR